MTKCFTRVQNGLGDKMLDVISFCVLCKFLNYTPHVSLNSIIKNFVWGPDVYDNRLFIYNDIVLADSNKCDYFVESPNPSLSSCPYNVYLFIKKFLPDITFEDVSKEYETHAKHVMQPSVEIVSKFPKEIEDAYGVHLRKTDKVNVQPTQGVAGLCENSPDEFKIIIDALIVDLKNIVIVENEPSFLFVSEDYEFREEIKTIIEVFAEENKKNIKIINIDYNTNDAFLNYISVMDMWCLSRCKQIFQGVKYSTFSVLASLLGSCKIVNYADLLNNDINLIDAWSSVITVNKFKKLDKKIHSTICSNFEQLVTNIK